MQKEALLYEKLSDKKVHCFLCAHHCKIAPRKFGFCSVRENIEGTLYTHAYGKVIAQAVDPIEKKPLYHFLPGSKSFSIATIGCNFKCGFCQNWQISQADQAAKLAIEEYKMSPEEIALQAHMQKCRSISYTYTEPTIFFEYAYETAMQARKQGIYNIFVTNGFMTSQTIDMIKPFLDAANIDLKSFSNEFYKSICKGRLQPVLDSIAYMRKLGIWVEVTTLLIPGQNDSAEEIKAIADFLAGVDKTMPWHISRFYPNYHFDNLPPTAVESLQKAKEIGENAGLRYVYLGNVSQGTDTVCFNCKKLLIKRKYMSPEENYLENGKCPFCDTKIDGIWS